MEHPVRVDTGFCSMRWPEVLQLLDGGMLVHRRSPPPSLLSLTVHWYPFLLSGGERLCECKQDTMTQDTTQWPSKNLDPEYWAQLFKEWIMLSNRQFAIQQISVTKPYCAIEYYRGTIEIHPVAGVIYPSNNHGWLYSQDKNLCCIFFIEKLFSNLSGMVQIYLAW